MLRVGLIGDNDRLVAQRLDTLDGEGLVEIVEPDAGAQLVIALGPTDARADVALTEPEALDELWETRLVPFSNNLAAGRRAYRRRTAMLFDHDPTWAVQAERLIARLHHALGDRALRIDHIGSTSVPGLPAKNLIDIQVVADRDTAAAACTAGFIHVGTRLCADRHGVEHPEEALVDADPGRPCNVNIRAEANPIWRETLVFRDWLRASAEARAEYLAMKRSLEGRHVDDYSENKIPWIHAATERAETWAGK